MIAGIASACGKMAFQTRLANRSPLGCEPVSVRNNASGDGKGILAAETGDRFGGQEAFRRPVVRRTCNPQPLSYGNHGLFGMDCKKAETARVVGGGRSLAEPVSMRKFPASRENAGNFTRSEPIPRKMTELIR